MKNDKITSQDESYSKVEDDEIDLIEVAKTIWNNRKIIYKTVGVFFILGLLIAFLSPVEYESETILLPEIDDQQMMGGSAGKLLQQFGGLAGISLDNMQTSTISPNLYPEILKSSPFLLHLMEQPVYFSKEDTTVAVYHYFTEIHRPSIFGLLLKYTIGLPGQIKKSFSKDGEVKNIRQDGSIRMTREQKELAEQLVDRIKINLDEQTQAVTVTSEMPDPEAAAAVNKIATQYLTDFVTNYRINKVKQNLEFIQERYDDTKERFEKAQNALANFRDRNVIITTARARTEEERLNTEFNLAFNVYSTLAQQLEQTKIKVQEETPVFNVLEPVKVPLEKSSPKRGLIVIITCMIGILFSFFIIFLLAIVKFKKS